MRLKLGAPPGALVSAVALLLAACGSAPENANLSPDERQVAVTPVGSFPRQMSGIRDRRRLVLRSAGEWAGFWREASTAESPSAPPEVDFTRNIVIAAALGQRPSGGYLVEITGVTAENGRLVATVREQRPGPDCLSTAALTHPVDAVVVSPADSVTFVEETRAESCQ